MYCYCHCPNNEQPLSAQPEDENHHHQQLEKPHNDHLPPLESGGCNGIWVYVCFQHMNPNGLQPARYVPCMNCHYPTPPPQHVSDDCSQKKLENYFHNKPTVRVYCKDRTDYSLAIYEGKVTLAHSNPSDPHQHWYRDNKFGFNAKDEEGFSSFALVNKATYEAMKHSIGVKYPVQLTKYSCNKLGKSVLWSMRRNLGDG